jgi:hypothetical protein
MKWVCVSVELGLEQVLCPTSRRYGACIDVEKPKYLEKNLSQWYFVHKSHMYWPGPNPGFYNETVFYLQCYLKKAIN